ncbi:MAG: hypothetical protein HYZ50_17170 [Deltaproteobacteria bacterium]|nr:hypothetical protein [Deltaproteobacteria bacterium]
MLFYGSCLRNNTLEGVLDFHVLVDSYRAAHASRLIACANAILPPNVFYVEGQHEHEALRMKYAVFSSADFHYAASAASRHAIVWGRFSQPFVLVYARDEQSRAMVIQSAVESILTFMTYAAAELAALDGTLVCTAEDLWQKGFQETYRSELRPELPETIRNLYTAAPTRYDRVAHEALSLLEQRGMIRVDTADRQLSITIAPAQRQRLRNTWRRRLPLAKALYVVRLVKSGLTFGDWLPYTLWKLHRHTGVQVELTERQRKHPLIWGWPVLFRVLAQRNLR